MYPVILTALLMLPSPDSSSLPPGGAKPKAPIRETISQPLPPETQPKLAQAAPQSWAKRHPAGTVALSIVGGAILGAVSCHNGWIICGDDDETGNPRMVIVEGPGGHCGKGGCD